MLDIGERVEIIWGVWMVLEGGFLAILLSYFQKQVCDDFLLDNKTFCHSTEGFLEGGTILSIFQQITHRCGMTESVNSADVYVTDETLLMGGVGGIGHECLTDDAKKIRGLAWMAAEDFGDSVGVDADVFWMF
jgi:hypothetical protein